MNNAPHSLCRFAMCSGCSPAASSKDSQHPLQEDPFPWTTVYSSLGVAGVLVSLVVVTVMSARKTQSPTTPGTFPKRSKKVR